MTSHKARSRFLTSLAMTGALAGVLIWAKLRLSTDMPRAAYADPKDAEVDEAAPAQNVNESLDLGEARIEGEPGEAEHESSID